MFDESLVCGAVDYFYEIDESAGSNNCISIKHAVTRNVTDGPDGLL